MRHSIRNWLKMKAGNRYFFGKKNNLTDAQKISHRWYSHNSFDLQVLLLLTTMRTIVILLLLTPTRMASIIITRRDINGNMKSEKYSAHHFQSTCTLVKGCEGEGIHDAKQCTAQVLLLVSNWRIFRPRLREQQMYLRPSVMRHMIGTLHRVFYFETRPGSLCSFFFCLISCQVQSALCRLMWLPSKIE